MLFDILLYVHRNKHTTQKHTEKKGGKKSWT